MLWAARDPTRGISSVGHFVKLFVIFGISRNRLSFQYVLSFGERKRLLAALCFQQVLSFGSFRIFAP
jgi:hypothetical protein